MDAAVVLRPFVCERRFSMRIAAAYEEGKIFPHFGKTRQFKIYETQGDRIVSSRIVDVVGSGHSALGDFLKNQGVQMIVCGSIGDGARMKLMEQGISLFPGVAGEADIQIQALLKGELALQNQAGCGGHGRCAHLGVGGSCGSSCC